MKKILALTLLLLSFTGSAFAAPVASNALIGVAGPPASGGLSVFGGVDAAAALAATNPLVKMSTGVQGVMNFDATAHTSYAIGTKHITGSKYFGTSNDSTAIFWKQSVAGVLVPATFGTAIVNDNFSAAGQWTAY